MLPWGQIISTSLTLTDLAHSLYKKTRKKSAMTDMSKEGLIQRVEALELLQTEQANLIQKIADQNNNLVRKIKNAYWLAIVSPLISLIILWLYISR